ncbi:MAG TPA: EscU/YscU/HrcU family type III secretion system export apparatus switch protein [Gammaproteobacteria bacterium]|nr:EscU/YscU/HrcU family type III secretion system export apparatus switch protein [Gammaproteobacteria bacterium]
MSTMKKNNADVAVALQWEGTGAPRVTAKGRGETAARILELAQQHDVPVEHERELVELLVLVDLNEEIPQSLYVAVAEIIAFAYSLRGKFPPLS